MTVSKSKIPWHKAFSIGSKISTRESRGFEIGTFNSAILSSVLKKQSTKWPSLAEGYICDIVSIVHIFTTKALNIACGDQRLGQNILSFLMDDLIEKYRQALSMTDFLLRIERDGTPMTLNHYLNSNLQKWSDSTPTVSFKWLIFISVARKGSRLK